MQCPDSLLCLSGMVLLFPGEFLPEEEFVSRDRLTLLPLLFQHNSPEEIGLEVVRIEPQVPVKIGKRPVEHFFAEKSKGPLEVRFAPLRSRSNEGGKVPDCPVKIPLVEIGDAARVPCRGILRVDLERPGQIGNRLFVISLEGIGRAAVAVRKVCAGIFGDDPGIVIYGLVISSSQDEDGGPVVYGGKEEGIDVGCAAEIRDCRFIIPAQEIDETPLLISLRIVGVEPYRLAECVQGLVIQTFLLEGYPSTEKGTGIPPVNSPLPGNRRMFAGASC